MEGRVTHLFMKVRHGEPVRPAPELVAADGQGLVGDLNFGAKRRQVLLIEGETLAEFGLAPGQVQENVVVDGVALAGLPAGTHLAIGEAVLEVSGDCAPCSFIEGIRPGLRAAMEGRRGTLAIVLAGGTIRPGEPVRVLAAAGGQPGVRRET